MRQIGGSIGIALIDTLLDRNSHQNMNDLASHVSVLNPGTQAALHHMGVQDLSQVPASKLHSIAMRMEQQVYLMSFSQMMWYVFFIFTLAFIPLYYLKVPKKIDVKAAMEAH